MLTGVVFQAPNADAKAGNPDFTTLTLEELMDVEITSVSKRPQRASEAAAAIFVITQDDIRRSGVTSIPEALRLAPGVQVARIDANKWAISIRGFNSRFANKLLVLIDGRSVYTPLFGGVFWDVQDTLLEDIDRIEVIRGPGATLWGANAVNGVINIITKHTRDTQGSLAFASAGSEDRGAAGFRYGDQVGEATYYRGFIKYFDKDDGVFDSGERGTDGWDQGRIGFRVDSEPTERDTFTLQGEYYSGETGTRQDEVSLISPFAVTRDGIADVAGGHVIGRWSRSFSEDSDLTLQLYYDRTERRDDFLGDKEIRDTFDLDFNHRFSPLENHGVVWGLGYRYSLDDTEASSFADLDPESRGIHLVSGFVQDTYDVLPDKLSLTAGSKFEWNSFSGFEFQPSARFLWAITPENSLWGSVSRAVRTPTRQEEDVTADLRAMPGPVLVRLFSNEDLESEEVTSLELGYRSKPHKNVSVDLTGFYSIYDDLVRATSTGTPFLEMSPFPPHFVSSLTFTNPASATTYGAELALGWQVADWWRVQASYSYLDIDVDSGDVADPAMDATTEGTSPTHTATMRHSFDITPDIEFDAWLRYVDQLPSLDVDSYVTLDLRLGWRPHPNVELSVVGQNLLDSERLEFAPEEVPVSPTAAERSVYGKIKFEF